MTAKCSMCHGSGFVKSQTICDCKKLLKPPSDWKPVVGEKVLVEATVTGNSVDVVHEVVIRGGIKLYVHLSSIRPIKEGE